MKQVKTNNLSESFEELKARREKNIDEINNLIHTSDWEIDGSEGYDEKDGKIYITLVKEKK